MVLNWWRFEFQRKQQLWNIFCKLLKGKATGTASFEVINYLCSKQKKKKDCQWCDSICTDGKAAMTG
jgi:hypothetical protein